MRDKKIAYFVFSKNLDVLHEVDKRCSDPLNIPTALSSSYENDSPGLIAKN
jgi:hypothetical protein